MTIQIPEWLLWALGGVIGIPALLLLSLVSLAIAQVILETVGRDRYLIWLAPLVAICCIVLIVSLLSHVGEPHAQWLVCDVIGLKRAYW